VKNWGLTSKNPCGKFRLFAAVHTVRKDGRPWKPMLNFMASPAWVPVIFALRNSGKSCAIKKKDTLKR